MPTKASKPALLLKAGAGPDRNSLAASDRVDTAITFDPQTLALAYVLGFAYVGEAPVANLVVVVDLGACSTLALIDRDGGLLDVLDMPVLRDNPKHRSGVNPALLADFVRGCDLIVAYVEHVGARPGEELTDAFAFGRRKGVVEGVKGTLGLPLRFLTLITWKRAVGIARRDRGEGRGPLGSRAAAACPGGAVRSGEGRRAGRKRAHRARWRDAGGPAMTATRVDFRAVNDAALRNLPAILQQWLTGGRLRGREYVARNPMRADKRPGSLFVNVRTGRWCDFACGDRGGALPSTILPRLGALLRLLGSNQDGEALGACRAIDRTLRGAGMTLHDLADQLEKPLAPVVIYRDKPAPNDTPSWAKPSASNQHMQTVATLAAAIEAKVLTKWERVFAQSIVDQLQAKPWMTLSEYQQAIVDRLISKWQEAGISS